MATYITLLNFTDQGIKTIKEGPSRLAKAKELAKAQSPSMNKPFSFIILLKVYIE